MPHAPTPHEAQALDTPSQAQHEALLEELAATKRELLSIESRFEAFMEQSPFLSFVKSMDGRMLYYNRRFAERFGISRTAWLGKTDFDLFPAEHARVYRENDLAVLRGGGVQQLDEPSSEADGSPSRWQVAKFPCAGVDGTPTLGGIAIDITEAHLREQKIDRLKAEVQSLRQQVEALTENAVRERGAAMREHKEALALAEV